MPILGSNAVEYIRNRKDCQNRGVCFSFWYKPDGVNSTDGEKNKARAEIDYYDGSWHNVANGTVTPVNATEWHMAQVNCRLPTTTTQVKLRVRGYPYGGEGFKAWVDRASLSVYYYDKTSDPTYGDVALVTSIYHSQATQIPEFDGFMSGGIAVATNATSPYKVHTVELTAELLPNNQSATTQIGRIYTLYSYEANEKSLKLGSGAGEADNSGTVAGLMAIKAILFVGGTVIAVITPEPMTKLWGVGWVIRAATGTILAYDIHRTYSSPDFYHDVAAEGQIDYYTKDEWKYYQKAAAPGVNTISWAEVHSAFDWRFNTATDDVFAVKITAKVTFGRYEWNGAVWTWTSLHTNSTSIIASIANYWN